jgi:hypothetical protein
MRVPVLDDLAALVELRRADRLAHTGSTSVDREAIESEGRRTGLLDAAPAARGRSDGQPRAWIIVHDRAAGRTMVALYVDRSLGDGAAPVAGMLYAWAEEPGP